MSVNELACSIIVISRIYDDQKVWKRTRPLMYRQARRTLEAAGVVTDVTFGEAQRHKSFKECAGDEFDPNLPDREHVHIFASGFTA